MSGSYIKRKLVIYSVITLFFSGLGFCLEQAHLPASTELHRLPVYCVDTKEKQAALTFDAAWGNSDTEQLLELLKKYQVKATFFVTGDFCDRCEADVRAFAAAGHDIQNHSDFHPHPNQLSQTELIEDTMGCSRKIQKLTGKIPHLYRAPYGEYNTAVLEVIEDRLGMQMIQWSADSRDWKRSGVNAAVQNVMQQIETGGIILFHNDLETTVPAVEKVIQRLKARGYSFVLVRDMIYSSDYIIDPFGKQRKKL